MALHRIQLFLLFMKFSNFDWLSFRIIVGNLEDKSSWNTVSSQFTAVNTSLLDRLVNLRDILYGFQLVVHTDYRNQNVAKQLLYSIWCESSNFAWGIVSSNPYAIRALEKATRRRSSPKIIRKHIEKHTRWLTIIVLHDIIYNEN